MVDWWCQCSVTFAWVLSKLLLTHTILQDPFLDSIYFRLTGCSFLRNTLLQLSHNCTIESQQCASSSFPPKLGIFSLLRYMHEQLLQNPSISVSWGHSAREAEIYILQIMNHGPALSRPVIHYLKSVLKLTTYQFPGQWPPLSHTSSGWYYGFNVAAI